MVPFRVLGAIAAVGPVIGPVVLRGWAFDDLGTRGSRVRRVRVHVIHEDAQALRVGPPEAAWALPRQGIRARGLSAAVAHQASRAVSLVKIVV